MKFNAALLLALLGAGCAPLAGRPTELLLADHGTAALPIVIAADASDATKAVAAELAGYLEQISGAKFDIQIGDGARGIVLRVEKLPAREAFVIRSEPHRLLLAGGSDLGVSHAAFRLLELLGCRWFFPSKAWEIIPSQRRLAVAVGEADQPRILARRIWYGYGFFDATARKDYETWARHNRMASSFRVSAGHAWQSIIADNSKVFAEHPEYRALVKGKRQGEQLCVSNPDVQHLAVEWALKFFQKNPDREMVSMECSDGDGQCECDACAKLGSISDRVFLLANIVARAVAEKYPDKQVGCLAYNQHSEPPSFPLEPNVYVQLTAGFIRGRYRHEELIDLWARKTRNLGFYEYFSVWLWDFDKLPGGNGANLARTQQMIRRYLAAGATSFDAESGNNWGVHGRGYYIANRLLWNPDADVPSLLTDFYEKAFGPGAAAMRRYYERLAPENEPLLSRSLVGEAFRDVAEAVRLARSRPDVQARLDQLKHYLRYVHLRWMLDNETDKARRKELTLAALTLVYRTRYEYMNHWAAMRSEWVNQAAKEFNEPTWTAHDRSIKPWMIETPVTAAETEQWFQEGLAYFQPQPVTEVKFSADLAPAGFTNGPPAEAQQHYQRSARYALHSPDGNPLELEVTPGTIAWYRDRPDARYTLTDIADATNTTGRLPLDGAPHKLTFKVPRPGTYFFECDDSAAGWRIRSAATLVLQRGRGYLHLGQMPPMFFYVPKGTRAIQYFWKGPPHKVLDPDGKLVHHQKQTGEIVTIPVPAGMDGRCWSFRELVPGHLWFFNVPNYLAASPRALLLPRELLH